MGFEKQLRMGFELTRDVPGIEAAEILKCRTAIGPFRVLQLCVGSTTSACKNTDLFLPSFASFLTDISEFFSNCDCGINEMKVNKNENENKNEKIFVKVTAAS